MDRPYTLSGRIGVHKRIDSFAETLKTSGELQDARLEVGYAAASARPEIVFLSAAGTMTSR